MDTSPAPAKKRRSDGSDSKTDYNKCIICQNITRESCVQNVIDPDIYSKIIYYVTARAKCAESEFFEASKRLEPETEASLKRNAATYHATCRKNVVSAQKLERAQDRYKLAVSSQNFGVLERSAGRPVTPTLPEDIKPGTSKESRPSRSNTPKYNKDLCFFCQTHTDNDVVHSIRSEVRGQQLRDFVDQCDCDKYTVYLRSAIHLGDSLPSDVKYHCNCWQTHVLRGCQSSTDTQTQNDKEIAAKVSESSKIVAYGW
jgi:hypothetical protein